LRNRHHPGIAVSNDNTFSQLSTMSKAKVLARLIHAETIHARDAYTVNSDEADGIRLRERNETVHRLSGFLRAVLGEHMSAAHQASMVGRIDLIVAGSQHRRAELARWIADAANQDAAREGSRL
jgi:hypothetical protein